MKEIEYCKLCNQIIKVKIDERSIRQLNLYWSCIEIIREHKSVNNDGEIDQNWNTKEKCHSQIRWILKFINKESAVHFQTDKGSKLYFELKSISFEKSKHEESTQYINDAFSYISSELGITVEELIRESQSKMQSYNKK